MTCDEVKNVLSALIDDELDVQIRERVEAHLRLCTDCAQERADFVQLSKMAGSLTSVGPSEELWSNIEKDLSTENPGKLGGWFSRRRARTLLRAALVLLAIVLGLLAYSLIKEHPSHPELDLAGYVKHFHQDPVKAQKVLMQRWNGRATTPENVAGDLGYLPAVSALPEGYRLKTFCVLDMPCCRCPQAVLVRADGSTLAVFEYETDRPAGLGDRAHIRAVCANCPTTLIQVDSHLAATWKARGRFVTIVGARDVEEVSRLVASFNRKG